MAISRQIDTRLNRTDYLLLILYYAVSSALNCIEYYNDNNTLIEYLIDIPLAIVTSFLTILIFMYWLIPTFIVRNKQYILFAILGLALLSVVGTIERITGYLTAGNDFSKLTINFNYLLGSIFSATDDIGFLFGLLLTKKFYESQVVVSNIQKQQKENELKLLRSQIDPHFLFNNLNTLDALIDSDSEKAKEYINRLSSIYRYLIQTKDAEVMELAEELKLAKNYIFLIETKFGHDYEFVIEEHSSMDDKFIPTGALQTLLENVVKHSKPISAKTIKTVIQMEDQWLTVTNEKTNNKSNQESFGTGLENLRSRYQLLSDQKIEVKEDEKTFTVSIPVIGLSNEN